MEHHTVKTIGSDIMSCVAVCMAGDIQWCHGFTISGPAGVAV